MSFTSTFHPDEIVIDDDTPDNHPSILVPDGQSTGLRFGMRSTPFGAISGAPPFPTELIIPRSEWQARIQEQEASKSRLSDIIIQSGLPCKNQEQTNFCWANAPTHCVEILQVKQNGKVVILSPASVACPINGFKNQGGWGEQALERIISDGASPISLWPANAIDRKYYTDAEKGAAAEFKVTEWWEIQPRNLDQYISCLLLGFPCACGYNWQGHETCGVDAVWVNGAIGTRNRNSWSMDWPSKGAGGWYILQGTKMYPDDCVSPRSVMAS